MIPDNHLDCVIHCWVSVKRKYNDMTLTYILIYKIFKSVVILKDQHEEISQIEVVIRKRQVVVCLGRL